MDKTTTPSAGRLHRVLTLALATLLIAGCATGGSRADSLSRQDSDSFTNPDDAAAIPPDVLKIPQFPVPPHATVAGVPARRVGMETSEQPSLDMDQQIIDSAACPPPCTCPIDTCERVSALPCCMFPNGPEEEEAK